MFMVPSTGDNQSAQFILHRYSTHGFVRKPLHKVGRSKKANSHSTTSSMNTILHAQTSHISHKVKLDPPKVSIYSGLRLLLRWLHNVVFVTCV